MNCPNIIGAIDDIYIRIIQLVNGGSECFNYTKYFSIARITWADENYKFVYVDIGANGASCDYSIF